MLLVIFLFVFRDSLKVLFADFIFNFKHPLKVTSAFVFWGRNRLFFLARSQDLLVEIVIVRKVLKSKQFQVVLIREVRYETPLGPETS